MAWAERGQRVVGGGDLDLPRTEMPAELPPDDGDDGTLVVQPGDTLIILHKARLSEEIAEVIKKRAMARIPGLADVVVIQADGLAVYRPDPVSGDVEHTG